LAVSKLRKALILFVMASDELISSLSKGPLSPAEQAIIDFYIKEIPSRAAKADDLGGIPALNPPDDIANIEAR
jgi:hypothetical protein